MASAISRRLRPHYGWIIVAACLVGISTGPAAFGIASIGLVSGPMAAEFGWDRTQLSLAVSVMMLCTAGSLPLVGRLVDRLGVKRVLVPSVVVLALTFMALPLVSAYWQFIALYVVMGTLAVGTNSVPYMRLLAAWFDRSRGLAIGIAGSGTGLGFAYVPLFTELLVSEYGWRGGYLGLGLLLLIVTLPLVLLVLKESPAAVGLAPDGVSPDDQDAAQPAPTKAGDTLAQALGRRDFWILVMIFMALAFVLYGLLPHLVPLLTDRGLTATAAASIASVFGASAFAGRVLIGFLIDRFDARRIGLIFFSLSAVGLACLALPMPIWAFLLAALLLGGSLGAEVDMLAYLTSRYFGLRCFAEIFGVLFATVMVAMGLGPLAFGMVFDATGSYQAILFTGVPVCIAAVLLLLLLRPYQERARGGPVSVT